MNRTMLTTLFSVLFLSLLCGCPRTDDGAGNTAAPATTTPATDTADTTPAAENPCTPAANPCGENPCTDNPCGENPCGENPCADNPCGAEANPCADNPCGAEAEDTVTTVVLETTDGDIVLEVHSAWSPLGAAHFLELVNAGFYDGAPWFRVKDQFVAQCGVAADPAMNAKWGNKTIMDEPVVIGNKPGFVSFGKSGMPDSRSTHIFINTVDNSAALNPQGFASFAQVVEGMDVAMGLFQCEFRDQAALGAVGGLDAFKQRFPDADYIKRAYVRN